MFNRRCVIQRLQREMAGVGTQGSQENPTPVSTVCHGFGCIGCVAEKVARKADRETPASCNKVALMTGESNSDEVFVIPRLRIALV